MGDGLQLGTIGQLAMTVRDLDASIEFYRDQLGLPLIAQAPPRLAFFDCGGVRLMVSGADQEPPNQSVIYFTVPDIQSAYEALRQRGLAFDGEPQIIHSAADYELWMAFFKDPAGNVLAIMDERGTYVGQ